jgi:hypothetical protein
MVSNLGGHTWRQRSDGCGAVDLNDEYPFSNMSNDIRKNAPVTK